MKARQIIGWVLMCGIVISTMVWGSIELGITHVILAIVVATALTLLFKFLEYLTR